MPNWCGNQAVLTFPSKELHDLFLNSVSDANIFSTFAPLNLGEDENGSSRWEFSKAIEVWGTKCEPLDVVVIESSEQPDENWRVRVSFDTAWAPPIGVYERLNKNHGILVKAYFHESGEEVFGMCTYNGDVENNKYYNYPRSAPQLFSLRECIGINGELDAYMFSEWTRLETRWSEHNSDDSF